MANYNNTLNKVVYICSKWIKYITNSLLTAFEFRSSDNHDKQLRKEYLINSTETDSIELTNCF